MKIIEFDLDTNAKLTCYLQDFSQNKELSENRPCVVICPGGGYYNCVKEREGEPIALQFLAKGFNAFVLEYSVNGELFPQQLLELSSSIIHIRKNSKDFNIDKDDITVCGFSAGGHLACSLGTFWHEEFTYSKFNVEYGMNKPNKLILCYPVISTGEFIHQGSFDNLLGENPTNEILAKVSLENQITENMPSTFIWHGCKDTVVPVENSFLLCMSLRKQNIPFESHFYQNGLHGMALCNKLTTSNENYVDSHIESWFGLALKWLSLKERK